MADGRRRRQERPSLRSELRALDPDIPLSDVSTIENYVDDALASTCALSRMLGGFSVMAALLAAIGLFGVLSCMVALRGREIGIRMALGAASGDVLRRIARQGLTIALTGVGIGLLGAAAATRALGSALFGVEPVEPAIWATVSGMLLVVAVAAAVVPARRATRIDPMRALREE